MDTVRRSVRISRRDRVRNEVILQLMGRAGTILDVEVTTNLVWACTMQGRQETAKAGKGMAAIRMKEKRKAKEKLPSREGRN